MRPAWLVGSAWQCSYCGRDLRIGRMRDGTDWFRQGWMPDGDQYVYRKSHHRGTVGVLGRDLTAEPARHYPTPAVVTCRNRDCGERVVVGLPRT